ncbi:hypothetical protein LAZ67_6001450 [Cordylochernes scorpioides]|uniref:HTH CENPB-type domain-containing protein n=1 Tax=Cordylochernes scorpioides TaxID=51811 RepID=A0ABY6KM58_9ARAC|nr:hypothetical protein LAZ67_6001450 [Cordylochernes scorpioides]
MPGHRKRRQFKQTDAFTRGMVIGLKTAGWSIRQIAADTNLGASTVHRLWRRWLEQGNVAIYRNVGATRVTSARVDRRILRQAVAAPQATCTAILQHVQDTLDHSISTRTISRRLVANGLHSCRPLRRLPLTPPNRRQRLEWCRARSTWMTEWHRVVFSDESRFCLSSDSRRVRVWRRRGERSNPAAIVERPTVRQRGIMGVPNALYQQDNARPHTNRISQQALQDVQMLPWPPYSPDLSPIEHVWDIIGRRLHALPQPRSEDELWQMVEREWRAIPEDAIRTLIDSLPRRVAACIAVRGRKRLREPGNPDLDKCVLKWFKQARDKKIPVSGHLIRSKAEQFATEMGKTDFKASSGWLDGFKERNKISFKTICGESGAVNLQVAEQWKNNLRELIQDKDARDVFNHEKCHGGKLSKERVTLLVGANMDGFEKLPLLMIGKAANPRCFKNVKTKPVDYANSARAWMTSYLFEKWLLNLDKKFTKEKRKVILFIDNCTAHNSIPPMENVEVIFFPANMTSVIQPMDKGVIKNLKHFYRRFLVENILTGDSEALKIKLDVLQASRLCKKAWDQVTSETIKHCFKKAGFVKKEEDEENAYDIIAETMPSVDGWEDVISNPTISYDDFLNMDDDVAVCGEITDADIIAEVLNHNIEKQDGDEASGDEDESSVAGEMNVPSAAEATNYIMQLRRFFESKKDAVVVEADWKAWECPYTKNEDTVALGKFREQIKVELGAKDGEIRSFLTDLRHGRSSEDEVTRAPADGEVTIFSA